MQDTRLICHKVFNETPVFSNSGKTTTSLPSARKQQRPRQQQQIHSNDETIRDRSDSRYTSVNCLAMREVQDRRSQDQNQMTSPDPSEMVALDAKFQQLAQAISSPLSPSARAVSSTRTILIEHDEADQDQLLRFDYPTNKKAPKAESLKRKVLKYLRVPRKCRSSYFLAWIVGSKNEI